MRTFLKILALLCLLVTICGAAVVLYAVENREPRILEVQALPLTQEEETAAISEWRAQMENGRFSGRRFAERLPEADGDHLCVLTLQLENRGLLPMEWIAVGLVPAEGDLAEMTESGAYVLPARGKGDLHLTRISEGVRPEARVWISYYLFGHAFRVEREINWTEGNVE